MANYMSMDNLRFVLHEVLNAEELCQLERYKDHDKESFDIMLDSTKSFADKVLFPVLKTIDEDPARYEDGKVIVHPVVGEVMKYAGENGAIGATFDYDQGGMQLPHLIGVSLAHISQCANNSLPGYMGLTTGAANLIVTFGEQKLIDRFVPQMMSGKWAGTMCLTEPQAGSSLSDITTSATPKGDGSYRIKGQKIFISGGDHEYCDNFIHLVLARIDGAPAGLAFGEKDNCQGWLVGPENKGLSCMFQMMNGARIDVGLMGASVATAAYYASLQYAQERPQGRRILANGVKNVESQQTTIINHPDVRRMLLLQRAVTEGSISLLLLGAKYHDLSLAGPEEDREKYHDLLEIITPIAKTYPSEMGRVSVNAGLQILGGYGFCTEFPLEQYSRDIRIMSLYEGTTGIQSLDLLGRKVTMKNGAALKLLTKEIIATIKEAATYEPLQPYADQLKEASKDLETTVMHLLQYAMSGNHERYIADATIFMEYMSNIAIAWQWLRMATVAHIKLQSDNGAFNRDFYASKIHTMKYFYKYELTKNHSLAIILKSPESLTLVEENKEIFA